MNPLSETKIPAALSWQRLTVLVGAVIVTIGSGTNYGVSGWAPQLGAKLNLSHTQVNIIALAGNLGVYSTGPPWGRITDSRGPFILFAIGFFCLLLGYSGLRFFFDAGLPENVTKVSVFSFLVMVVCGYMTGAGGNAGVIGALSAVAKTFPDRMRATTAGIVLSGFGLSAFFFSEIAHMAFGGEPSPYLNLLAWGTSIPMILGLMVVRPIPLPASEVLHADEERSEGDDESGSYTPLLGSSSGDATENSRARRVSRGKILPDIFGKALWTNVDFWVLFITLTIFSGTGLMYINNVGSMAQVLVNSADGDHDPEVSARWQATQVSTISISNFAGRILFGLLSDFANKKKKPRSFCLFLVSLILLASQIIAGNVDKIEHLWAASSTLGLGYGGTYVLVAALLMDYFGLAHFSENWGYLLLSPLVGGNIFSLVFGRNLDAHEPHDSTSSGLPGHSECTTGRNCYVDAIYLTIGACVVGTGLSAWICWTDWRRRRQAELEDRE